ncbi:RimJ/RimL family protein N-acetyltransferase [Silvimonas terrae]|uniref:RimJ/RimL family protein N-acetyltransferase n=1 Tax=Silvimonas terrae TaxID=300266 RepID=A0A840R928_9NEIS|nr:GNAT family N-acetyltransferase [Silvimonas terrae]MBB5189869.1 RimJ/RimL family protein N-acetyltransferase [Silvimonas terrae]
MPQQALVRPATPDDAAAIAAIHITAWQAAYAGIIDPAFLTALDLAKRTQRWQHLLTRDNQSTLVTISGEEITGWVGFGADDEVPADCGALKGLYIAPQHWQHGYGTRLLTAACTRLRQLGWRHAGLVVLQDNHAARAFYERAGFTTNGVAQPHTVGQQILPVLQYRRPLDTSRV